MEPAQLLPRPGEKPDSMVIERTLRVLISASDEDTGILVREGLVREKILTTVQEDNEEFVIHHAKDGWRRSAPHNPFLTNEQIGRLDERGVVRVGTVLQADDVLVSVLKRLVPCKNRPARPGKCWVRDDSRRVIPEWEGATVTSAEVDSVLIADPEFPPTDFPRVRIAVRIEHDLVVGDALLYQQEPVGLVVRLLPDVEMPERDGKR